VSEEERERKNGVGVRELLNVAAAWLDGRKGCSSHPCLLTHSCRQTDGQTERQTCVVLGYLLGLE
jgi:hypothetical protein